MYTVLWIVLYIVLYTVMYNKLDQDFPAAGWAIFVPNDGMIEKQDDGMIIEGWNNGWIRLKIAGISGNGWILLE